MTSLAISLMSPSTKTLLNIIMARMEKIYPELGGEQCGFVEDKDTINETYVKRTLIKRAMELQKDMYVCDIDYTKTFDIIRYEIIISIMD